MADSVNIRPGVSVLSVLRHLNYQPWYALAEFVDNSVQSYTEHQAQLEALHGRESSLHVDIHLDGSDGGRISVLDNAAGIAWSEYDRAFRPAELPPDRSGLSEFGMGMKSAACWFAGRWFVRTTALGEPVERTVHFDIEQIVKDEIEELRIEVRPVPADAHYTEVVLTDLHKTPVGRTVAKIKDHLASIYREFIRSGRLLLRYNGEVLTYSQPEVLNAPYYTDPKGEDLLWEKAIEFDFGKGLRARGFAALRAEGSTREAGFALFRRDRVIEGSADDGYRPKEIFGSSNSYRYQRLFGELHLDGFEVSHTKDGFVWDENEEPFLSLLKARLDEEPLPLLKQAEGYRARGGEKSRSEDEDVVTPELVSERTARVLVESAGPLIDEVQGEPPEVGAKLELESVGLASRRMVEVPLNHGMWRVALELADDEDADLWVDLSDDLAAESFEKVGHRDVGVRVSLSHPFTVRFAGANNENLESLVRLAVGVALGEVAATAAGVSNAPTVRRNLNKMLRGPLSEAL